MRLPLTQIVLGRGILQQLVEPLGPAKQRDAERGLRRVRAEAWGYHHNSYDVGSANSYGIGLANSLDRTPLNSYYRSPLNSYNRGPYNSYNRTLFKSPAYGALIPEAEDLVRKGGDVFWEKWKITDGDGAEYVGEPYERPEAEMFEGCTSVQLAIAVGDSIMNGPRYAAPGHRIELSLADGSGALDITAPDNEALESLKNEYKAIFDTYTKKASRWRKVPVFFVRIGQWIAGLFKKHGANLVVGVIASLIASVIFSFFAVQALIQALLP